MSFFCTEKTIRIPASIPKDIVLKHIQIRLFQKGVCVPSIKGNTAIYNKDSFISRPGAKGGWIFSTTDYVIVLDNNEKKKYQILSFHIKFNIKRHLLPLTLPLIYFWAGSIFFLITFFTYYWFFEQGRVFPSTLKKEFHS
jgi:hypothetical protein